MTERDKEIHNQMHFSRYQTENVWKKRKNEGTYIITLIVMHAYNQMERMRNSSDR